MRILGIESSSRRGSVALLEGQNLVASIEHEQPNSHAERLLPLLEQLLAEAGWPKSSLDRLGVGVGPGSFTGLRAGIALVEGLSVGLDRPLWGVGSLQAMARGALVDHTGPCCALLDARRNELFAAVYDQECRQLCAPLALPIEDLSTFLATSGVETVVGEVARTLVHGRTLANGPTLELPHARWVAVLTGELAEASSPPDPQYVRGIGATLPTLPRSPINSQ
ncbi:MAG TPA: tRNA (adenosine(37)-N6)-threonylcarbamoyltransferase complex dimerization subunit type 1 TsaB [Polyangiaceae bacterium]|nr:tRNA (adenosine(37)-N6)-threonylcarbamoyltransferase complex dimerization subunit type 1 TsaB [Polyangiaceae bacterium]